MKTFYKINDFKMIIVNNITSCKLQWFALKCKPK